jgi:hypothetical protein
VGNNLSAVTMPYYPFSIALDVKHRLYTVCISDVLGNTLYVMDKSGVEVANYKIPSQPAELISIGLQQNGSAFLVLANSNIILRLKFLLP